MTIIFTDMHFQEIFRWENCTAIPRVGDGIDLITNAYVVMGVAWRTSTTIHISLKKVY